jgi:Integrase core domain
VIVLPQAPRGGAAHQDAAPLKLREWEDYYNYHRPHGGLGGQTPYERLRQKTQTPAVTDERQPHTVSPTEDMPRSAGQAVVAVTVLVSWNVNPTPIQMASSLIVAIASRHGRHDRSPHKCMAFYGSLSRFCEAQMDSLGSKGHAWLYIDHGDHQAGCNGAMTIAARPVTLCEASACSLVLDLLRQQSAALTPWADARICTSCWHAIPPIAVVHPSCDHRVICATCWERQQHGDPDYVPGEN